MPNSTQTVIMCVVVYCRLVHSLNVDSRRRQGDVDGKKDSEVQMKVAKRFLQYQFREYSDKLEGKKFPEGFPLNPRGYLCTLFQVP